MVAFSVESFARAVEPWRDVPSLWIAYSGGHDSTVLLHAAVAAGLPVRALHVDHGLHTQSGEWAAHCRAQCQALGVALRIERVTVQAAGEGLEAAARKARYRAYAAVLTANECLATAHHADDQAETVLLRVLRGTGVDGLAGMPVERALGAGRLIRPLLAFRRADLAAYAACHALSWVDDPANECEQHDRSFLRQRVVPLLEKRWPGVTGRLARLAGHAATTSELAQRWAVRQLKGEEERPTLAVSVVVELDEPARLQLLRTWMRRRHCRPPPERRLRQGLADLLCAAPDRQPALEWADGTIRRYQGRLYLLPPCLGQPLGGALHWDMKRPLIVPDVGRLEATASIGRGLRAQSLQRAPIAVRFRQGGECMRVRGHARDRTLKRLLQERAVPPWVRGRLPLLYIGRELAAVADLAIAEAFAAGPAEPGWELHWYPALAPYREDSAL